MSVRVRLTPSDLRKYLAEIDPPDRLAKILISATPSNKFSQEVQGYLTDHGVRIACNAAGFTEKMSEVALKRHGARAQDYLLYDPFEFIGSIPGVTFEIALGLWRRLSPEPHAHKRIAMAAVNEEMDLLRRSGSIFMSRMALTNSILSRTLVPRDEIHSAIELLVQRGVLISDTHNGIDIVVRADALRTEKVISALLRQKFEDREGPDFFTVLCEMSASGIDRPDDSQIGAVQTALSNKVALITGGPGTGKSTILSVIARLFAASKADARIKLVSLAARVARAIGAKTGIDADTIHGTLGVLPGEGFVHGAHNPLPVDLLIVEEAFMIGNQLLADLLLAAPTNCMVIFVGDPEQLPPVMAGSPLHAIMAADVIPTVTLTTNHRSLSRDIPAAAKRVMSGRPLTETENIRILRSETVDEAIRLIKREFALAIDTGRSTQILTAMHDGQLGTVAINRAIAGHSKLQIGDLVMQTVNDRESLFFNGELANVLAIEKDCLVLKRDDGEIFRRTNSQAKDLVHAWAITYHKSQGLEYDTVILVVSPGHAKMLGRNIINVGLTRAKSRCIVIEHRKALEHTASKDMTARRQTLLKRLLKGHAVGRAA